MANRARNADGTLKYKTSTGHGLGYYVHYRWTNYHNYGITYRDVGGVSAAKALSDNHKKLKENLKWSNGRQENLLQLESFLNGWIRGGNAHNLSEWAKEYNFSEAEIQQIEDSIKNEMDKRFPQYIANLYNLDLSSYADLQNLYVYQGKGADNKKYVRMSTFKRLYENLEKGLEDIGKRISNGNLKTAQLNALIQQQTKINKIIDEMFKIVQTFENSVSQSGKSIYITPENKNSINNVIKMVAQAQKSFQQPSKDEQGEMAEIALSMFFGLISGKAANTTDELIQGIYKGKIHATNTPVFKSGGFIQADYLFEEFNKTAVGVSKAAKEKGNTRYKLKNGDIVDVIGSQQTTDLVVTLPDQFSDWGVNNLTASLKSYSNLNSIKILTETSLFLAFNFVENNFANHYLNMFASTYDSYDRVNAELYNDELKRALLVRGLMGVRDIQNPSTTTAEIADVFIIFDKINNKFHIYNTGDLASKYFDKIDEVYVSGLPSQGALSNVWQGERNVYSMTDAMQRITKLLISSRRIKLTASIKNIQNVVAS